MIVIGIAAPQRGEASRAPSAPGRLLRSGEADASIREVLVREVTAVGQDLCCRAGARRSQIGFFGLASPIETAIAMQMPKPPFLAFSSCFRSSAGIDIKLFARVLF